MFNWIRARVRDAFLAGIQDGIDALSLPAAPAQVATLLEPRVLRLPPADADNDGGDDGTVVVQAIKRGKK